VDKETCVKKSYQFGGFDDQVDQWRGRTYV